MDAVALRSISCPESTVARVSAVSVSAINLAADRHVDRACNGKTLHVSEARALRVTHRVSNPVLDIGLCCRMPSRADFSGVESLSVHAGGTAHQDRQG